MDLQQAKDYLKENWKEGVKCPCCTQMVKLYEHKFSSRNALILIKMAKETDWVNPIQKYNTVNGDYAKMRHWGLIEKEKNDDPTKKASGLWRVTKEGFWFANNVTKIKEKALLYNNKCYGLTGNIISIKAALGNKFNYRELMSN